jgi:uncharacterized caspase-like protein
LLAGIGIWGDADVFSHCRLKMQGRMQRFLTISISCLALLVALSWSPAIAEPSERRFALVIGNASYKSKALATPVSDAALIAQTLRAAGFDVMGARDLDGDLLRQTFRDFVASVGQAGPGAVAVVYFAGIGLQLEGENYLVPIDADITEASDVPLRAMRLSEQMQALATLHLKASFVVLDIARASSFLPSGQQLAGGLAWVEPETNMLIACNAAPGTVSPDASDGYGPYARALAEMIREGGLTPAQTFDRVRLRVNELTKGAEVPWDISKIETQFMFLERGPGAPPRADAPERIAWMRSQPMSSLGIRDAYMVALARDTFDGYADFVADYWHDPKTRRIRALLAARREAITWRLTHEANVPSAYWSYLERYPSGPHVADARRLLTRLAAATEPPPEFARLEFDMPPPLPDELEFVERRVLALDDPAFAFEPPQPSPVDFLEPPPSDLSALAPPAEPAGAYVLPTIMTVSLPAYLKLPADVVAPPSMLPPDIAGDANGPRLPPSVALRAAPSNGNQPLAALRPEAWGVTGASPNAPWPMAAATSAWPTDSRTPAGPVVGPPAVTGNHAPPIAVSTLHTGRPTGVPQRTPRAVMLSPQTTGSIPVPVARPVVTVAPLPTGTAAQTQRAVLPSPQAIDGLPQANPRPAKFPPPPPRTRPKPVAGAAATPSQTDTDGAGQPSSSQPRRLQPSTRAPNVAFGVSPPEPPKNKPPKKLCPIVDGQPNCG